jgi:hypothetical protein
MGLGFFFVIKLLSYWVIGILLESGWDSRELWDIGMICLGFYYK